MKKSVFIRKFGGPEVFEVREEPKRDMGDFEVRIQVSYAGVNFADIMMRMGLYPEAPKPPFVPGYEISGVVSAIGAQVTRVKTGDRVLAGCRFGGYTTQIDLPESSVYLAPAHLSDAEAASIPVNFMTAWIALEELARVRKGDRVLIQGAAGGVGLAAIQIAKWAGAEVVGTIGSAQKTAVIQEFGASRAILNADWENGSDSEFGKFDIILDPVGGASLKRSYRRLDSLGRLVSFGLSSAMSQKKSIIKVLSALAKTPLYTPYGLGNENKGIFGVNLLTMFTPEHEKKLEVIMHEVLRHFQNRVFRAHVGRVFSLTDAGAAQGYLQSRAGIGKVVLDCRA